MKYLLFIILFLAILIGSITNKRYMENFISSLPTIKYYYKKNCSQCDNFKSEYYILEDHLKTNSYAVIEPIIDKNNIYNVPTIVFHNFEEKPFKYTGKMKAKHIINFIKYKYSNMYLNE